MLSSILQARQAPRSTLAKCCQSRSPRSRLSGRTAAPARVGDGIGIKAQHPQPDQLNQKYAGQKEAGEKSDASALVFPGHQGLHAPDVQLGIQSMLPLPLPLIRLVQATPEVGERNAVITKLETHDAAVKIRRRVFRLQS
jgi:hypothetical protein